MSPSWPQIRAALLAAVILAHGLVASPLGPRVTRESLARPANRAEVEAWYALARPLGWSLDEFEEALIVWSDRLITVDEGLTRPFKPFLRFTRTGQAWGLFAVPDATPSRLEVHGVTADGTERLLYRRLDPEHAFLAAPLDFRRVRGVWDIGGTRKSLPPRYRNLARWAADRALEAHPDLVEVIVVQQERRTTLPGEPPDTRVQERHRLVFERAGSDDDVREASR